MFDTYRDTKLVLSCRWLRCFPTSKDSKGCSELVHHKYIIILYRYNRLLIVHGLIDENVLFRHTSALVDALNRSLKPYTLQASLLLCTLCTSR